ncbi:hypothetical protein JQM64_06300 [Fournierella massiliensis]|nr:hypothetical protein [Fournierella massiliensis]MCF2557129.1 hypothetical protein [Fournierella massiliensis]
MTETQVEIVFDKACSNVLSNSVLEQLLYDSMCAVPLPQHTEQELAFAAQIKVTYKDVDPGSDLSLLGVTGAEKRRLARKYREMTMVDFVVEHRHQDINIPGSSDVGDCSHVVPTAQFVGACFTPWHTCPFLADGGPGKERHRGEGDAVRRPGAGSCGPADSGRPADRGTCQGGIYSGNRRKTLCLPHPF